MLNDAGLSQSWKERALAYDIQQETEEIANMGNREVSVMWASSQGGCDPLNRLKNVDFYDMESQVSSSQSPSAFPYQSSFSGGIALVEEHSQASCSGTSLSCFNSSRGAALSNGTSTRPPKRTHSSITRSGDDSQNGSASPSSSWTSKNKLTNPSKDALSRISRSLNQMVSECTSSQKLRTEQMQSSKRSLSQPHSLCTHVSATARLAKSESLNRGTIVQRQPEVSHPVRKRRTQGPSAQELHTPTITNSPRKARIKALLKTIDHAGPFPEKVPSLTTLADDHKSATRIAIRKDREQENLPHSPQLKLGLPHALPIPAHSTRHPPPPSSIPVANLVGDMLQSTRNTISVPSSLHADSSHLGQITGMQHGNETRTARQPWKTKGYRSSDPYSAVSCGSGSPLVSDDNLIAKGDKCRDLELILRSTRLCADTESLSLTPRIGSIPGSDDVEVNLDEASSSSYGDIDIDPMALEDACKAYDP